jgi:hypothetical protein
MNDERSSRAHGISRRALAKTLGGAATAAAASLLPVSAAASLASGDPVEAHVDAMVEAALAATPATLTPEQRLEVRRGVRDLQKALADVRRTPLDSDVDPATVFLPGGWR